MHFVIRFVQLNAYVLVVSLPTILVAQHYDVFASHQKMSPWLYETSRPNSKFAFFLSNGCNNIIHFINNFKKARTTFPRRNNLVYFTYNLINSWPDLLSLDILCIIYHSSRNVNKQLTNKLFNSTRCFSCYR